MTTAELSDRLNERLGEFDCRPTDRQLAQLVGYCELLARWNRRINLTALPLDDFPRDTLDVLIVEPIVLVGLMPMGRYDWFDFGSGGGSPAIPIKIMAADVRLTLIEARSKKSAFLQEVLRSVEIENATVHTTRIEDLEETATAQLVTVRGVRIDAAICQAAQRVLQPRGSLAAFATAEEPNVEGFSLERSVPLPSQGHVLYLLKKRD